MASIKYSPDELDNITDIEVPQLSQQNGTDFVEYHIADILWSICSPILLCVGITGNILSFLALQGSVLRTRVSSLYLKALSIADTFALIFGLFPVWPIHLASYDVTAEHDAICKLRNFLFYTFSDISVWLICAFTFDRLIAVVFPLKKRNICTKRHALTAILVVVGISVVKNVEILITRSIKRNNESSVMKCTTPDPMHNHYNTYIRPWIVFTSVTAVPFIFITACNACIIRQVYKVQRSRSIFVENSTMEKPRSQIASMTRMCLTVSFTFLLLISPSIILLIGKPYWTKTPSADARFYLARSFGNMCQYTNNAINFILYCGSGRLFRKELIKVVTCTCSKRSKSTNTFIASQADENSCTNMNLVQQDGKGYNTIVAHGESAPPKRIRFL